MSSEAKEMLGIDSKEPIVSKGWVWVECVPNRSMVIERGWLPSGVRECFNVGPMRVADGPPVAVFVGSPEESRPQGSPVLAVAAGQAVAIQVRRIGGGEAGARFMCGFSGSQPRIVISQESNPDRHLPRDVCAIDAGDVERWIARFGVLLQALAAHCQGEPSRFLRGTLIGMSAELGAFGHLATGPALVELSRRVCAAFDGQVRAMRRPTALDPAHFWVASRVTALIRALWALSEGCEDDYTEARCALAEACSELGTLGIAGPDSGAVDLMVVLSEWTCANGVSWPQSQRREAEAN